MPDGVPLRVNRRVGLPAEIVGSPIRATESSGAPVMAGGAEKAGPGVRGTTLGAPIDLPLLPGSAA
ncbi:hypothetical protein [Frankia sp. QA3]|uniref:hypothetical protein n=1 Tax=Frankia sp. QA3 TaxID=710111 RepID=UPI000269C62C|nr:hypothetical protein [Frankia sp. QA3]EIV94924.1 hypothetical protein FraQA3DRAFT_4720 [Frankia sp. QA3]